MSTRCWLVRLIDGHQNAQVFALKRPMPAKSWRFNHGIAAIGKSLTETIDQVFGLKNGRKKHAR